MEKNDTETEKSQDDESIESFDDSTSNITTTTEDSSYIKKKKFKISEYPTFNGQNNKWYAFKDDFEATAMSQGYDHVLARKYKNSGKNRKKDAKLIFSALKKACSGGSAHIRVKKYSKTLNGNQAWKALCNFYKNVDSKEQRITDLTTELSGLSLDYKSPGGFKKYMERFEVLTLRLEENGAPMTDLQKKTHFLCGITDRDYESSITICRTDPDRNYDRTILLLHAEAKRLGKLHEKQRATQINQNYKQGNEKLNGSENETKTKPLPPEVWAQLDQNQRQQWARGRENKQPDPKFNESEQYQKDKHINNSKNEADKDDPNKNNGNKNNTCKKS